MNEKMSRKWTISWRRCMVEMEMSTLPDIMEIRPTENNIRILFNPCLSETDANSSF